MKEKCIEGTFGWLQAPATNELIENKGSSKMAPSLFASKCPKTVRVLLHHRAGWNRQRLLCRGLQIFLRGLDSLTKILATGPMIHASEVQHCAKAVRRERLLPQKQKNPKNPEYPFDECINETTQTCTCGQPNERLLTKTGVAVEKGNQSSNLSEFRRPQRTIIQ